MRKKAPSPPVTPPTIVEVFVLDFCSLLSPISCTSVVDEFDTVDDLVLVGVCDL